MRLSSSKLDVTKTRNGERGTRNEGRGTGEGERGAGSGERGTSTPKLSVLLL